MLHVQCKLQSIFFRYVAVPRDKTTTDLIDTDTFNNFSIPLMTSHNFNDPSQLLVILFVTYLLN